MIVFAGHNRTYKLPAVLAGGSVTGWDLLDMSTDPDEPLAQGWASGVLDKLMGEVDAMNASAIDCMDCEDFGFYGVEDPENEDILRELVRKSLAGSYDRLTSSGWAPYEPDTELRVLTRELAEDLASVVASGGEGLALRYVNPLAWLEPSNDTRAIPLTAAAETAGDQWTSYAIVDDLDLGAVLNLVRLASGPKLEAYTEEGWKPDESLLSELKSIDPPLLVELSPEQLADVEGQIKASVTAAVSPDPRAEKLRRYWSIGGKGGLKIRWGLPGDMKRCMRQLRKYLGPRASGYCANLHKRNTGMWPGSRANRGLRSSGSWPTRSVEQQLYDGIIAGAWLTPTGRVTEMQDGIYAEVPNMEEAIMDALTAGAFPVAPPDEWFDDPKLKGPTPLVIEASGRVSGHIATFDIVHIGMPGKVHAPRSRSGYAYFKTGDLVTASGAHVSVGNLTLAGGHAPLNADAGGAVAHYDNTASAIADVNVGEDKFGIWVAGAVRPEATAEQVRALRASAPSGDWRPINGNLELVAVCQVNVPGFPVTRARVASGAVMALVAAGARPLAEMRYATMADQALASRVAAMEAALIASGMLVEDEVSEEDLMAADGEPEEVEIEAEAEAPEAESVETAESPDEPEDDPESSERVNRLREEIAERKRQALRDRVRAAQ